jgi:hypothetical protein
MKRIIIFVFLLASFLSNAQYKTAIGIDTFPVPASLSAYTFIISNKKGDTTWVWSVIDKKWVAHPVGAGGSGVSSVPSLNKILFSNNSGSLFPTIVDTTMFYDAVFKHHILTNAGGADTVAFQYNDSTIAFKSDSLFSTSARISVTPNHSTTTRRYNFDIVPGNVLLSTLGGNLNLNQLAQNGATTGQVPKWSGSAWVPGDVAGGSFSDGGYASPINKKVIIKDTIANTYYHTDGAVMLDNNPQNNDFLIDSSRIFVRRTPSQILTLIGAESLSNKATDFSTINNTKYPTTQAVSNFFAAQPNFYTTNGYIDDATRKIYAEKRKIDFQDSAMNNYFELKFDSAAGLQVDSYVANAGFGKDAEVTWAPDAITLLADNYDRNIGMKFRMNDSLAVFEPAIYNAVQTFEIALPKFKMDSLGAFAGTSDRLVGVDQAGYIKRIDSIAVDNNYPFKFSGNTLGTYWGQLKVGYSGGMAFEYEGINPYTSNKNEVAYSSFGNIFRTTYGIDTALFTMDADSSLSQIVLSAKDIFFKQLSSSSDTSTYKPFGISSTGKVVQMASWFGSGGGGGGSSTFAGLTDVNVSSPSNGQFAQYQTSDNKWHNHSLVAGDIPDLSSSYIKNGTSQQTSANFNIDGYGIVDTIYGSTASGGNLYLFSTSNATKGKIYFGANNVLDVANNKLGIGTASPINTFHLYKSSGNLFATFDDGTDFIDLFSQGSAAGFDTYGDFVVRAKTYANRGTGSWDHAMFKVTYAGTVNIPVTPATYSSGGYSMAVYNTTSGNIEKVPALSLTTTGTSGAATYNAGTGVLNIPTPSSTATTWAGYFATINASATSYTLNGENEAVFNGSSPQTFTLPTRASSSNEVFLIKNRGTATLTISANTSESIYTNSLVSSFTIAPGESAILVNSYLYWNAYVNDAALTLSTQTTNATATTLTTYTCPSDASGTLVVDMVASKSDNSKSLAGKKTIHWHSTSGTVTVDEVVDEVADYLRGFTTATWTVDASSGTLRIRVTGEASTTVNWNATYKIKYQ